MNDKELLTLAAKAAGYKFETRGWVSIDYDEPQIDYIKNTWWDAGRERHDLWNPLTDDADALRLAVKLGISLTPYPIYQQDDRHSVIAKQRRTTDTLREINPTEVVEVYGEDPYAATRRAIVRAASEIGRGME